MPFVARHRITGQRVCILDYPNPRAELRAKDYGCPLCDAPFMVKAGLIRRPHFAHYAESPCSSEYDQQPETIEHLETKLAVYNWVRAQAGEYTDAAIDLEVPIPEVRRVADVLVTFPMGYRQAWEIQLSSITVEKISERTSDYNRAGIDVFWLCGGRADTPAIREWCLHHNHGLYLRLEMGHVLEEVYVAL